MELGSILKPAKTNSTNGKRGFVFAAEISDEHKKKLDAIRDKARSEGKTIPNGPLAETIIEELHNSYVKSK